MPDWKLKRAARDELCGVRTLDPALRTRTLGVDKESAASLRCRPSIRLNGTVAFFTSVVTLRLPALAMGRLLTAISRESQWEREPKPSLGFLRMARISSTLTKNAPLAHSKASKMAVLEGMTKRIVSLGRSAPNP